MSACSYLASGNQKLLFAKRLIKLAGADNGNLQDKHLSAVLAQSVTLQLYWAWAWHLQDVADNYKVADPSAVKSADDLVRLLEADGKTPAEAIELQYLASSKGSWLNRLLGAYHQLSVLPEVQKAQMDADRLPLLALDKSSDGEVKMLEWSMPEAVDWTAKMTELVDRQREMMIEF